eukprot:9408947-Pyramimonas_sp.AAC.1
MSSRAFYVRDRLPPEQHRPPLILDSTCCWASYGRTHFGRPDHRCRRRRRLFCGGVTEGGGE